MAQETTSLGDVATEDGYKLVAEIENTADYYYGKIVEHWNNSVNSMIQMGVELADASAKCDEGEFATLQERLEKGSVCSKKQQEALMNLPKSKEIKGYYQKCISTGNKPSLPTDLRVLLAVSQLEKKDFDRGIRDGIIGSLTTIGDINKLKSGTHHLIPASERVKIAPSKDKLEGKLVAKLALDFDKIETKKQAQEVDDAITSVMDKISSQYSNFDAVNSVISITELYSANQEKAKEKIVRKKLSLEKKVKTLVSTMKDLDPSIITGIDPATTKSLATFLKL